MIVTHQVDLERHLRRVGHQPKESAGRGPVVPRQHRNEHLADDEELLLPISDVILPKHEISHIVSEFIKPLRSPEGKQ